MDDGELARIRQQKPAQLQKGGTGAGEHAGDPRRGQNDKQKQTKEREAEKRNKLSSELTQKDRFNIASMLVLLYFSTAMVVLPLGVYFIIYWYIIKSTTLAALGAVVVVQLIVAAFIYKAWHDEKTEASDSSGQPSKAKDKKQS